MATKQQVRVKTPHKQKINGLYEPGMAFEPVYQKEENQTSSKTDYSIDRERILKKLEEPWTDERFRKAKQENVLFTWGATNPMQEMAIEAERGEGVYFYDRHGKKYLDFNSQAMCVNLGHTLPPSVMEAITNQLSTMPYAYPGVTLNPMRAKLSELLAEVFPGDINSFLFPSSGSEANEMAIRMARGFTKRHKILSRYRSYHGGTLASISASGDLRRWPAEKGSNGHIHFFDPYPYSFSWGNTEEEVTRANLGYLKELIALEGPQNIAAILVESVTGTNGVLKPPAGYLEGLREICDHHGILMICDEVMCGFGRTGKLFGFSHSPSVVPDMVTFAKGLTGAFLPLGGVGMRDHIANFFRINPINIGSTYNSHPVCLAAAYACVEYILKEDILSHVAKMEHVMKDCMNTLAAKHPCIKQGRVVGLFGCLDLQKDGRGSFLTSVFDPPPPFISKFRKALHEKGLFTMVRGHHIHCNPPLIIQPDQLREGFQILDECLGIIDEELES